MSEGQSPTAQARQFADWTAITGLFLLTRYGTATHIRGGTLDLVWVSQTLIAAREVRAKIAEDLQLPSDHTTIRILLAGGTRGQYGRPGRFRLDQLNTSLFNRHLSTFIPEISSQLSQANLNPQPHLIDNVANSIVKAIQKTLLTSASRSREKATGFQ